MTTAREFTYLEAGLRILMAIVLAIVVVIHFVLKKREEQEKTALLDNESLKPLTQ